MLCAGPQALTNETSPRRKPGSGAQTAAGNSLDYGFRRNDEQGIIRSFLVRPWSFAKGRVGAYAPPTSAFCRRGVSPDLSSDTAAVFRHVAYRKQIGRDGS